MNRNAVRVAAVLMVALMVAPALGGPPTDGFPLSTYPMFAADRGSAATIATAVVVTEEGVSQRLNPSLLAGADEPVLAVRTASQMVNTGRADLWCVEVAGRVAGAGSQWADAAVVQVRSETYDVVAAVRDNAHASQLQVHAECRVEHR